MPTIIAVDPGTTESGFVVMRGEKILQSGVVPNRQMEVMLMPGYGLGAESCIVEMIASYGMPVGKETFETCVWIGRFLAAFGPNRCDRLFRKDVKVHLCGSMRAKDPNVWQAIVDRYGPGKEKAIGSKKNPGPLYGVTSHQRAALAVGICWLDGVRSDVGIVADTFAKA